MTNSPKQPSRVLPFQHKPQKGATPPRRPPSWLDKPGGLRIEVTVTRPGKDDAEKG